MIVYNYEIVLQKKITRSYLEKLTKSDIDLIKSNFSRESFIGADLVGCKYVGPVDPEQHSD